MSEDDFRINTRIAISKHTRSSLKQRLRGGETFDRLLRRMLVSNIEKPIGQLTDEEQNWVFHTS